LARTHTIELRPTILAALDAWILPARATTLMRRKQALKHHSHFVDASVLNLISQPESGHRRFPRDDPT